MKKNTSAISAVVGGVFFAVPYLAIAPITFVPSLAIGAAAFCASELILKEKKEELTLKETNITLYNKIKKARLQNNKIHDIINLIEDKEVVKEIEEINATVEKILQAVEKNPEKEKKLNNFFEYYLPSVEKILIKYDDIENQRLSSKESKKFISESNQMIKETNQSFKNILNSLYQSEIQDTDIEMKVLNSMLKSEGYDSNGIINREDENEK